jgi:hypothetical protein
MYRFRVAVSGCKETHSSYILNPPWLCDTFLQGDAGQSSARLELEFRRKCFGFRLIRVYELKKKTILFTYIFSNFHNLNILMYWHHNKLSLPAIDICGILIFAKGLLFLACRFFIQRYALYLLTT